MSIERTTIRISEAEVGSFKFKLTNSAGHRRLIILYQDGLVVELDEIHVNVLQKLLKAY